MTVFEKKLKNLFDAQNFFQNQRLNAIINEKPARELDDNELSMVNAAGDQNMLFNDKTKEK